MSETKLLHGRARNSAIKAEVRAWIGAKARLRVQLGSGTASRWAYIECHSTPHEQRAIEAALVRQQLVGQYPDDMSNDMYPCVSWRTPRVSG